MEVENDMILALFGALADAEAALHALQDAGVPYPDIDMGAHSASELDGAALAQLHLADPAPAQFWSLAVVPDAKWHDQAIEVLRKHEPLALGRAAKGDNRRDDTERGAIAWRHYVFESPAAADWAGESAGTTGFTGLTNSGVFAEGTLAEGNPPTTATPLEGERPSDADVPPTSDTRTSETEVEGSRPETKLE